MSIEKTASFQPDTPILSQKQDALQFTPTAERLANKIIQFFNTEHKTSIVIGIEGSWGQGKTSFLNLMKEMLEKQELTIDELDPWGVDAEKDFLEFFLNRIRTERWRDKITGAGISSSEREKLPSITKELISGLSKTINTMGIIVFMMVLVMALKLIGYAPNTLAKIQSILLSPSAAMQTTSSSDMHILIVLLLVLVGSFTIMITLKVLKFFQVKEMSLDNNLRKIIKKQSTSSAKNYLFIVDNLDRLSQNKILNIFSAIRVAHNIPKVVYVLAYDPEIISLALGGGSPERGRAFIGKIIQVPLPLPSISPFIYQGFYKNELQPFLEFYNKTHGTRIFENANAIEDSELLLICRAFAPLPRDIKRLVNHLVSYEDVPQEIHVLDFIFLEAARIYDEKIWMEIINAILKAEDDPTKKWLKSAFSYTLKSNNHFSSPILACITKFSGFDLSQLDYRQASMPYAMFSPHQQTPQEENRLRSNFN